MAIDFEIPGSQEGQEKVRQWVQTSVSSSGTVTDKASYKAVLDELQDQGPRRVCGCPRAQGARRDGARPLANALVQMELGGSYLGRSA